MPGTIIKEISCVYELSPHTKLSTRLFFKLSIEYYYGHFLNKEIFGWTLLILLSILFLFLKKGNIAKAMNFYVNTGGGKAISTLSTTFIPAPLTSENP